MTPKSYKWKKNLWLQKTPILMGPKKFGCPYCSMVKRTLKMIEKHVMIHTGIKPFHCQFCKYSAKQKVHLKSHMAYKHKDIKFDQLLK